MIDEIQKYFNDNKYVVIRNFLDANTAALFYEYSKTVVRAIDYKSTFCREEYNKAWDGSFGDGQIPNSCTFYQYGDPLFDTLMYMSTNTISQYTGLNLNPNYTYWRFYQTGDVLERHRDRPSCEISTTLCLGYDVSNVDTNVYPNYNWPIYVEGVNNEEIPVGLNPGDLIIYKGCEVDHWRDKFLGSCHAQVFMHYNDANGPYANLFDGRPMLGIPSRGD